MIWLKVIKSYSRSVIGNGYNFLYGLYLFALFFPHRLHCFNTRLTVVFIFGNQYVCLILSKVLWIFGCPCNGYLCISCINCFCNFIGICNLSFFLLFIMFLYLLMQIVIIIYLYCYVNKAFLSEITFLYRFKDSMANQELFFLYGRLFAYNIYLSVF